MLRTAIVFLAFMSAVSVAARQTATSASSPIPQNPQDTRPPRDPHRPNDAGTARIRGRVIGGDSGAPLRRATVAVYGPRFGAPQVTLTDDNGRYEFKDVPGGSILISASKGGYIDVNHGQRRLQQAGRPVELAAGQTIDVDFNLPRGGAISGRITDDIGEPAVGANVIALRMGYGDGKRGLQQVNGTVTDDYGRFRVFGLPAGDYYISATLDNGILAQSEARRGSCRTFYPGTANASEARRLRVTAGGENTVANFAVLATHTVQMSGSVIDSMGRPTTTGTVNAVQTDQSMGQFGYGSAMRSDGTFLIPGLNPGDYLLFVQLGPDQDEGETASMLVNVGTEDVTGITIVTQPPSTVRGHIVFERGTPQGATPNQFGFSTRPLARELVMTHPSSITVRDDWTFETRLRASPSLIVGWDNSGKWTLKAVTQGGVDVTDSGIQFKPGEAIDNVQFVMSDRTTTLSGSVVDDKGSPAASCSIVIFPEDSALWPQDWRFIRTEQPDARGRFFLTGLPQGRYLAVAVDGLEEGQASDVEYLEQLRDHATPFVLAEDERKTITLTFRR